MKPVTTAIIGCGPRGNGHARAAMEGGALTIKAACDIRRDRLDEATKNWGVPGTVDYREILKDDTIEAVNIVTDVNNHLHIVRDALRAGKHIICEKPFGHDITLARELGELAADSGLVTTISFQLRFAAKYAAMYRASRSMDPVQILMGRSRGMMSDKFLNPSPFCGMMDVCAHDFDLVCFFMGRTPQAVTAVVGRNTFTRDTGATDLVSALIDFGDGRSATVVSSIGAAEIGDKFDLSGTKGNLCMARGREASGVRFEEFDSQGSKTEVDLSTKGAPPPDVALQQAFQREIREGKQSHCARFPDGINSLLLTLASLKSMDEGRRVELAELT